MAASPPGRVNVTPASRNTEAKTAIQPSALRQASALLLGWLGLAFSAAAPAQSLLALAEKALAHDAQQQSQQLAVTAAQQRVRQARAGLLPQVGLQAGSQYSDTRLHLPSPMPNASLHARQDQWALQASQPLYRPVQRLAHTQSQQALAAQQAQLQAAHQSLLLQTTQAYAGLLLAQEGLRVQRALEQAVQEQANLAQRNFELGLTTITDSREAQAQLDSVRAQALVLEHELQSQQLQLQTLTGHHSPIEAWSLPDDVPLPSPAPLLQAQQDWLDSLAARHPQLQQAQAALEAARLETRKAQAAHRPTVDLQASYAQQRNPDGSLNQPHKHHSQVASVGVQLQMPLFAGFALQAREQETLALEEKAHSDYLDAQRKLNLALRQSLLQLQSSWQQAQALDSALASSLTAWQANQTGYAVGVRINADVLQAQANYHRTHYAWTQARYQNLLAQLQARHAAGRLSLQDVAGISQQLQSKTGE